MSCSASFPSVFPAYVTKVQQDASNIEDDFAGPSFDRPSDYNSSYDPEFESPYGTESDDFSVPPPAAPAAPAPVTYSTPTFSPVPSVVDPLGIPVKQSSEDSRYESSSSGTARQRPSIGRGRAGRGRGASGPHVNRRPGASNRPAVITAPPPGFSSSAVRIMSSTTAPAPSLSVSPQPAPAASLATVHPEPSALANGVSSLPGFLAEQVMQVTNQAAEMSISSRNPEPEPAFVAPAGPGLESTSSAAKAGADEPADDQASLEAREQQMKM